MDKSAVLFDSDAFIGLLVPQDFHHDFMEQYIRELDNEWVLPATTNAVVFEAATFLSKRFHHKYATRFLDYLTRAEFEVHDLSRKDRLRAQELFGELSTAHNSLVDCCNVAAAERLGIGTMASFDKFYGEYGLGYLTHETEQNPYPL